MSWPSGQLLQQLEERYLTMTVARITSNFKTAEHLDSMWVAQETKGRRNVSTVPNLWTILLRFNISLSLQYLYLHLSLLLAVLSFLITTHYLSTWSYAFFFRRMLSPYAIVITTEYVIKGVWESEGRLKHPYGQAGNRINKERQPLSTQKAYGCPKQHRLNPLALSSAV